MLKFDFSSIFANIRHSSFLPKKNFPFMKIELVTATIFFIVASATSCKKDDVASVPVSTYSVDGSYTETGLTKETLITKKIDANVGGYVECLPAHYADHPTLKYPLIIYLHGQGSCGDGSQSSLTKVQHDGITNWITNQKFPSNFVVGGTSYQFIVLSPQFKQWPTASDVNAMLNYAIGKYHLDYERIYVSGNSMGGGITWNYGTAYGKRITAIVPVSGADWPTTEKAQPIADDSVAVWAFCNSGDSTVPAWYSVDYVQYINSFDPYRPAKLTEFNASGHNASSTAYDPSYEENGLNVYEWMLSFRKIKYK